MALVKISVSQLVHAVLLYLHARTVQKEAGSYIERDTTEGNDKVERARREREIPHIYQTRSSINYEITLTKEINKIKCQDVNCVVPCTLFKNVGSL